MSHLAKIRPWLGFEPSIVEGTGLVCAAVSRIAQFAVRPWVRLVASRSSAYRASRLHQGAFDLCQAIWMRNRAAAASFYRWREMICKVNTGRVRICRATE